MIKQLLILTLAISMTLQACPTDCKVCVSDLCYMCNGFGFAKKGTAPSATATSDVVMTDCDAAKPLGANCNYAYAWTEDGLKAGTADTDNKSKITKGSCSRCNYGFGLVRLAASAAGVYESACTANDIANCATQMTDDTTKTCSVCTGQFKPASNSKTCEASSIANCAYQSHGLSSSSAYCVECDGSYYNSKLLCTDLLGSGNTANCAYGTSTLLSNATCTSCKNGHVRVAGVCYSAKIASVALLALVAFFF